MNKMVLSLFTDASKKCAKCGQEKQLTQFHRDARRLDGRSVSCARCVNALKKEKSNGISHPRPKTGQAGHDFVCLPDDDIRMRGRTRVCKDCAGEFPLVQFPRNSGSKLGRMWRCASCYAEMQERRKRENSARNRDSRRAKTFGISISEIQGMFAAQGGKCGICSTELDHNSKDAHIDHCHKTGIVRGILCRKCNHGIGLLKDSPEVLESAARYLRRAIACRGDD